mgnify:CR=1 FL=1
MVFGSILTVIYLIFVAIVAIMVVWNMFTSKDLYKKIMGAVFLIVLILRLFLIK